MTKVHRWVLVPFAFAVLGACAVNQATGPDAVDRTVRDYVSLRNDGELPGLLNKSCGRLYNSTHTMLAQSPDRRRDVVSSMRDHPVEVKSVVVTTSADHVFNATMTGSVQTPRGRQTASEHVEVRQYQDGYRVCVMGP